MWAPAPIDRQALELVLAPFGTSRTLPAEAYLSDDLFRWEQAQLLGRSWTCIGRSRDLLEPGQIRAVEVAGESVLLSHDHNGTLRAFSNTCRHRGHLLVAPGTAADARLVRCPYHSWTYRLDGSLRAAPTFDGMGGFDPGDWPLQTREVGEWHGWLFVAIEPSLPDPATAFGNATDLLAPYDPARLTRGATREYEVKANWKLIVENYHECYHCTSIHPALCRVTPPDSGADLQPSGWWCGGPMRLREGVATMSLDGQSKSRRLPGVTADLAGTVLYLGLFPNLLVSAHPDYVMTHLLVPLGPDRTRIVCEWLFDPDSVGRPDFDPAYAVDFWDITNQEDWLACRHVQQGLRNRGHRPGPLGPWESTVYQFLGMVARAYRGGPVLPPAVPSTRRAAGEHLAPWV